MFAAKIEISIMSQFLTAYQLVEFLNNNKFRRLVDKHDGNRYVKHFTYWKQLFAMVFGQLSNRESLRDLIIALEAHQSMCYHLRLGRVNLWPKLHLQQLAKTEITESSKILHST